MIQIVDPAKSYDALEELTGHAEKILQVMLNAHAHARARAHTQAHSCFALSPVRGTLRRLFK
jgi:hypothetical protein